MREMLLVAILVMVIVALAYLCFVYLRAFVFHPLRHMPTTPLYNILFGSVGELSKFDGRILHDLRERRATYGRVHRTFIAFGESRVIVADPKWIQHVLCTNSKAYTRGDLAGVQLMQLAVGNTSLLVTAGDVHRRLRRAASPAFKPSLIRTFLPMIQACAENISAQWRIECTKNQDDCAEISVKQGISDLTLDVIGLAAFGYDFGATDPARITEYARAFRMQHFDIEITPGSLLPGFFMVCRLVQKAAPYLAGFSIANINVIKFLNWFDGFRNAIPVLITEAAKKPISTENLLCCMQESSVEGKLSDEEVKDMVTTIILAGHETSSVAVSWTLLQLAEHADWQDKCREEILALEEITWDSLHALKTVKACLFETMRLFPTVPWLNRKTVEEDIVAGYKIPVGTDILIYVAMVHRDPDIWYSAEKFRPERFFDETLVPWDAFLPFGNGVHKCIGYQLATAEILAILVHLLRQFEFSNRLGVTYREKAGITMYPLPHLRLTVRKL